MQETIFVQIASYRDKELIPTIKDLIKNAHNPENLTFGICWQNDETESLDEFKEDSRFNIINIPYQNSKGCCWARSLTQAAYKEETYTMQIDAHSRFVPDWDIECIKMIKQLKSLGFEKPILTGYPPGFKPDTYPETRVNFPKRMKFDKFMEAGVFNVAPSTILDFEKLTCPVIAKYFAAGFYFAAGSFIKEIPYDPNLFFRGEETTITLRAYTHGYDLFHPHKIILWHEYARKHSPRNINQDARKRSLHRTNVLIGVSGTDTSTINFDIYGLGTFRTIKDYETFSGINFTTLDATRCLYLEKYMPYLIKDTRREVYIDQPEGRNKSAKLLTDYFLKLIKTRNITCAIEVGAYSANFSKKIKIKLPDAKVFAFEANPYNYDFFTKKYIYTDINYINKAVTHINDKVIFNIQTTIKGVEVSPIRGNNSILKKTCDDIQYREIEIESITLNSFIYNNNLINEKIALLIDAEGANHQILEGCKDILDIVDLIFIEVEEFCYWKNQWLESDVNLFLTTNGFTLVGRDGVAGKQYNQIYCRV